MLFKTFCNPDIFKTLVYSQLWYILKSKHIQSPAGYLRWSILLRTLCNYSIFRRPIYSNFSFIPNTVVSATPSCISYSLGLLTYCYQCIHCSLSKVLPTVQLFIFSVTPQYMSYKALDNAPHCRYLTEFSICFTS